MDVVNTLWATRTMSEGDSCTLQAGPLHIRIARRRDEFHYASERVAADAGGGEPDDGRQEVQGEWNRWVCGEGSVSCQLKPLLPPRAVVVRPYMPLQVIPGARVDLFVSIPVWVQVCLATPEWPDRILRLHEEPTVVLSNSWFGSPVDGELCYALKTRARRRLDELRPDAHLAVCPVTLVNEAASPLVFERLCIRLQSVSLYAGETHLWTNHGTLAYRGEDAVSGLRFEEGPPSGDGATVLLSEPREPGRRGGMQRALDSIRNFSTFWG